MSQLIKSKSNISIVPVSTDVNENQIDAAAGENGQALEEKVEKLESDHEKKISTVDDECLFENKKTMSLFQKILKLRVLIHSVTVRIFLMIIPSFEINYLSCIYESNAFYALFCAFLIIIIDGVYVVKRRSGHDYYWFSITIAVYVTLSLTLIITITEFKIEYQDILCSKNNTQTPNYSYCGSQYDICLYSQFIIILFLVSLVFARWFLPYSKRMSDEAIYNQVAGFTSSAADIIDIVDYFTNPLVAADLMLSRGLRFIFTLNLVQFCFSLQATKRRNKNLTGVFRFVDILFVTEAWSQLLLLFTQELPCLVIRLIFIFSIEVGFEFSLYFFVIKNGLMSILLLYRSATLTYKVYKDERKVKPV